MGTDSRRAPRRWPLRVASALLGALLALVAVELLWRYRQYGPRALTPAGMNSIRPLGRAGMLRGSPHPEIHWELKPGLDVEFKLAPFRTNAAGLRDREYALEKPAGTFRVAFVGDSFTMGSGVALEDVFHSRLERLWSERADGLAVDCLNFGVGGYNLLSYVGVLTHRALAYAPDLVVVCLTANDLDRPPQSGAEGPYRERSVIHPFWRLHCLDGLWPAPAGEESGSAPASRERRTDAPPASSGLRERHEDYLREQFGRLKALCEEAGADLVLVHLGHHATPARKRDAGRIREFALAAELPFYDTLGLFAGSDPSQYAILPDDGHPNAAAHALYARGLGRFLARQGHLPEALQLDGADG